MADLATHQAVIQLGFTEQVVLASDVRMLVGAHLARLRRFKDQLSVQEARTGEWHQRADELEAAQREICLCAAILLDDGRIIRGHRHDDCLGDGR